jgi:hypothetical protein
MDHILSSPLQPGCCSRYSITTHDNAPIKQLAQVRRPAVPISPTSRTFVTLQVLSDYRVVMLCSERRTLDEVSLSCEHWQHMHTEQKWSYILKAYMSPSESEMLTRTPTQSSIPFARRDAHGLARRTCPSTHPATFSAHCALQELADTHQHTYSSTHPT